MPFTITRETGCLRLNYEGEVTSGEILDCLTKTLALAGKTGCFRILADCSRMTGGHSRMVLDFVAAELAGKVAPAGFREAILLPAADSAGYAEHYEETAREFGFEVRLFRDEAGALEWLLK